MKQLILLLICLTTNALAIEAVVTVLETPMLKFRSYEAPVVQYLKKGDVIKLHPSINNNRNFDIYSPSPEKMAEIKSSNQLLSESEDDPLSQGRGDTTAYPEDEFLPTLDRLGNTVYVIASHLYLYYNDKRELNQKVIAKDPTDYRLQEPLLKNYPIISPEGYRGQLLLGFTQPYFESYDYKDQFKTKSYQSPLDLNFTALKQAPGNYQERLFLGVSLNFRHYKNEFSFNDKRAAVEEGFRFGLGPTISYDAFKGEKNRINLSGTVLVNFLDRLYVGQSSQTTKEERQYQGSSLSPRFSIQYHRKSILEEVDFILGTSLEIGTPTTFRARNAGKDTTLWRNLGNDTFTTRPTFTFGAFLGVQSAY
jgi:hypothetical protein